MDQQGSTPPPNPPQQPTGRPYERPSAQQQPPPQQKKSSAWKWFLGAFVVLTLAVIACCGLVFASIGSSDGTVAFGDSIALIHLDSVIAGSGDGYITPEEFIGKLNKAEEDSDVKAVLIRVDSPGGTVAASQEIAMVLKDYSKPVVVSIGDVGASGAYMVASQSDVIIATPTSAVGSIGVITQIPNVSGLLEKLGIEFTTLTAGEYKDAGSPYRSLTETETAMIQTEIDFAYDEFIRMVAEGRDLSEDEVREMATGWAWSGTEAKKMGLVDEIGTYNDAVDKAVELGGIEGDYEVVDYDYLDYSDFLYNLIGLKHSIDRLGQMDQFLGTADPSVPR